MSRLNKLVRFLTPRRGRDTEFETYYLSVLMSRGEGVPSAEEARRDYEPVRRVIDRAVIF